MCFYIRRCKSIIQKGGEAPGMLPIILSASLIFISTSIDYLMLFIVLFSKIETNKEKREIYLGHYLGVLVIVLISLICTKFLQLIPKTWVIGILGLVPIYQGIRTAQGYINDAEAEADRILSDRFPLWLDVFLVTVTLSGDNFGIFPIYFFQFTLKELLIIFLIFILGIYLLCKISDNISKIPLIQKIIRKHERIIVALVLISLGLYILWSNGTILHIYRNLIQLIKFNH